MSIILYMKKYLKIRTAHLKSHNARQIRVLFPTVGKVSLLWNDPQPRCESIVDFLQFAHRRIYFEKTREIATCQHTLAGVLNIEVF